MITRTLRQALAPIAAAASMALFAASAQAGITISSPSATVAVGGDTTLAFDLGFDAGTLLSSFGLQINYDATAVHLTDLVASYNGSGNVATWLAASGDFQTTADAAQGFFSASFFALDSSLQPLPPLPLAGSGQLSLSFHLDALPANGPSTQVTLAFGWSDENLDAFTSNGTGTITAVPEPESWALALAGLPLVMGWARRHGAKKAAASA